MSELKLKDGLLRALAGGSQVVASSMAGKFAGKSLADITTAGVLTGLKIDSDESKAKWGPVLIKVIDVAETPAEFLSGMMQELGPGLEDGLKKLGVPAEVAKRLVEGGADTLEYAAPAFFRQWKEERKHGRLTDANIDRIVNGWNDAIMKGAASNFGALDPDNPAKFFRLTDQLGQTYYHMEDCAELDRLLTVAKLKNKIWREAPPRSGQLGAIEVLEVGGNDITCEAVNPHTVNLEHSLGMQCMHCLPFVKKRLGRVPDSTKGWAALNDETKRKAMTAMSAVLASAPADERHRIQDMIDQVRNQQDPHILRMFAYAVDDNNQVDTNAALVALQMVGGHATFDRELIHWARALAGRAGNFEVTMRQAWQNRRQHVGELVDDVKGAIWETKWFALGVYVYLLALAGSVFAQTTAFFIPGSGKVVYVALGLAALTILFQSALMIPGWMAGAALDKVILASLGSVGKLIDRFLHRIAPMKEEEGPSGERRLVRQAIDDYDRGDALSKVVMTLTVWMGVGWLLFTITIGEEIGSHVHGLIGHGARAAAAIMWWILFFRYIYAWRGVKLSIRTIENDINSHMTTLKAFVAWATKVGIGWTILPPVVIVILMLGFGWASAPSERLRLHGDDVSYGRYANDTNAIVDVDDLFASKSQYFDCPMDHTLHTAYGVNPPAPLNGVRFEKRSLSQTLRPIYEDSYILKHIQVADARGILRDATVLPDGNWMLLHGVHEMNLNGSVEKRRGLFSGPNDYRLDGDIIRVNQVDYHLPTLGDFSLTVRGDDQAVVVAGGTIVQDPLGSATDEVVNWWKRSASQQVSGPIHTGLHIVGIFFLGVIALFLLFWLITGTWGGRITAVITLIPIGMSLWLLIARMF